MTAGEGDAQGNETAAAAEPEEETRRTDPRELAGPVEDDNVDEDRPTPVPGQLAPVSSDDDDTDEDADDTDEDGDDDSED